MRRHVAKFLTRVTEAEPVISLPLALQRRPALDGRSFPNQRNRSAKVGFVDLGGVGLDLEGKISYGHLGTIQAGDGEMSPDVIALSRVRNTSMVEEKRTISRHPALVQCSYPRECHPTKHGRSVDVPLLEDRPSLRVVVDGPRVSEAS